MLFQHQLDSPFFQVDYYRAGTIVFIALVAAAFLGSVACLVRCDTILSSPPRWAGPLFALVLVANFTVWAIIVMIADLSDWRAGTDGIKYL